MNTTTTIMQTGDYSRCGEFDKKSLAEFDVVQSLAGSKKVRKSNPGLPYFYAQLCAPKQSWELRVHPRLSPTGQDDGRTGLQIRRSPGARRAQPRQDCIDRTLR